jgi:cupin fold WbuC family metalloprotein
MKRITADDLQRLTAEAAASPRRRRNLNVHAELSDPVQRLCNAFEPGTYVRPHRHAAGGIWELFVVIRGRAVVLTFDDAGAVSDRVELDASGPVYCAEIPEGAWHTVASVLPGTVLFEVKRGPYVAPSPQDFAAWAPAEGDARCLAVEAWFRSARTGQSCPH